MTSSYQFQKGNDYCHILSVCDEQEVQHTVVDSAFVPWKEQVHYIPHFILHPTSEPQLFASLVLEMCNTKHDYVSFRRLDNQSLSFRGGIPGVQQHCGVHLFMVRC